MNEILDLMNSMEYGPAPEANGEVTAWLERHGDGFGHFIDGAFSAPGTLREIRNPATTDVLARVTDGTAADVDAAVAAARAAAPKWAALDGHARARHLYALARHLQQHARFLAVLETMDNGKPIRESRDIDLPLVARHFYHHAGWAELLQDEFPGARPHGVCGQVIPWNFPLLMLAWKIAPALAAGNTVVLKPAEYTPLTALAFAGICAEVGLPKGVVNIVTGDGTTGAALTGHAGVDKVAFTGSTDVGRIIRRQIAGSGKALTLELGGKSPFIVFQDADLDAAVEGVVDAIWFNQGEVCCAGSRILVQESVADTVPGQAGRADGDPCAWETRWTRTPIWARLSIRCSLSAITDLVDKGVAEGAELIRAPGDLPSQGAFFAPTIACNVEPAGTLMQEEIFGPVATLSTFRTPDEAVTLANNTRYGLAAAIWSENINLALELAAKVKAGVVWVNATNIFDAAAGFGGYRESGFGREGGREGMASYLAQPAPKAKTPEVAPEPPQTAPGSGGATQAGLTGRPSSISAANRPDPTAAMSMPWAMPGLPGLGNRKDIRNAVAAAHKATGWGAATGHNRAQVLYYIAENLSARGG